MSEAHRRAYSKYSSTLAGKMARAKSNAAYWQREYERLKAEVEAEEAAARAENEEAEGA